MARWLSATAVAGGWLLLMLLMPYQDWLIAVVPGLTLAITLLLDCYPGERTLSKLRGESPSLELIPPAVPPPRHARHGVRHPAASPVCFGLGGRAPPRSFERPLGIAWPLPYTV
jgi:hypothetical protein